MRILKEQLRHLGVVLDVSSNGFDKGTTAMGSVFQEEDDVDKWYLYYTGATESNWLRTNIGLAISTDGIKFRKHSKEPLFESDKTSSAYTQVLNPAVAKVNNRFYMILSGKFGSAPSRTLGIAYADDPKGPWRIIDGLIKPAYLWEGRHLDNGCSIVKLDSETLLVYYSSLMSRKIYDVFSLLRRYPVRRIGILKVRIHGTSSSSIETMRFSGNPLKHLNGTKGTWNESVFCPGHVKLNDTHYLFPAASIYSVGFPRYKQYIGLATSGSPYFNRNETSKPTKLIDGPQEKTEILPNIKGEIALDTPSPYLDADKNRLFLYYSAADRADGIWKTALTTFDLTTD